MPGLLDLPPELRLNVFDRLAPVTITSSLQLFRYKKAHGINRQFLTIALDALYKTTTWQVTISTLDAPQDDDYEIYNPFTNHLAMERMNGLRYLSAASEPMSSNIREVDVVFSYTYFEELPVKDLTKTIAIVLDSLPKATKVEIAILANARNKMSRCEVSLYLLDYCRTVKKSVQIEVELHCPPADWSFAVSKLGVKGEWSLGD